MVVKYQSVYFYSIFIIFATLLVIGNTKATVENNNEFRILDVLRPKFDENKPLCIGVSCRSSSCFYYQTKENGADCLACICE